MNRRCALFVACLLIVPMGWADAVLSNADALVQQAYQQQRSDVIIEAEGVVVKLLPDDKRGSRHQRFVVRLQSGQTLLIAHNIELAAKIFDLKAGDAIAFRGEYEWSVKGGTVHWTHHDPAGRHVGGWLKHGGQVYL